MKDKPAIAGGKPIRDSFLVFGKPKIENPEIKEVVKTMKSGWIGTGPQVQRFENMFKESKGIEYAVAVSSCTAALHLSLLEVGLKPDDEVITTPMTFCATINAILQANGKPVFVDCERDTMNIDPAEIEKKITKATKVILPVHFAGRPCNMEKIMEIAEKHSLKVVEDCAHAIEAVYHGKKIGTIGNVGCFSFYVTKNVITGEGGMIITSKKEYADQIRIMALHGMSRDAWKRFSDEGYKHYEIVASGFKYNLTDLQASIGIHQLSRVEKNYKKRVAIWSKYNEAFKGLPITLPAPLENNTKHALHLYIVLLDTSVLSIDRDFFMSALYKENIGTGVHYKALHLHPYYAETLGYRKGDFPNAEFISERTLSLPLSVGLTNKDIKDVTNAVSRILKYYS